MTATGHAILGTVIAAKIGNPVLAVPIAFLSHIAADAFPHWDAGTNAKKKTHTRVTYEAVIDVLAGFLLSYLLISFVFPQTDLIYAFFVVLAAQGFDWITAPYYFFHIKVPPFTWAYAFQKTFDSRLDKPWGIINQVGILLLIILIAKII